MNISFGNKIPISQTRVYNSEKRDFENATLYEYDGKDETDSMELACKGGGWYWKYKFSMTAGLAGKYERLNSNEKLSDLTRYVLEHNKFYTLESDNNDLVAICATEGYSNTADVHFLERNPNGNYKLAGRAMLASIAKNMLKESGASLEVSDPVRDKREFYTDTCGFEEKFPGSHAVAMGEDGMKELIDNFEQEVKAPILDISC